MTDRAHASSTPHVQRSVHASACAITSPQEQCGTRPVQSVSAGTQRAHCIQEHVILEDDHPTDAGQVLHLEWSPSNQAVHLMITTASGRCLIWSHGLLHGCSAAPVSLKDWRLDHTQQLPGLTGLTDCQISLDSVHLVTKRHAVVPCGHIRPSIQRAAMASYGKLTACPAKSEMTV